MNPEAQTTSPAEAPARRASGDALREQMRFCARLFGACADAGEPELLAKLDVPAGAERAVVPNRGHYLVIASVVTPEVSTLEVVSGYRLVWPVSAATPDFHALVVEPFDRFGVQQRPFHPLRLPTEARIYGWKLSLERWASIEGGD